MQTDTSVRFRRGRWVSDAPMTMQAVVDTTGAQLSAHAADGALPAQVDELPLPALMRGLHRERVECFDDLPRTPRTHSFF